MILVPYFFIELTWKGNEFTVSKTRRKFTLFYSILNENKKEYHNNWAYRLQSPLYLYALYYHFQILSQFSSCRAFKRCIYHYTKLTGSKIACCQCFKCKNSIRKRYTLYFKNHCKTFFIFALRILTKVQFLEISNEFLTRSRLIVFEL